MERFGLVDSLEREFLKKERKIMLHWRTARLLLLLLLSLVLSILEEEMVDRQLQCSFWDLILKKMIRQQGMKIGFSKRTTIFLWTCHWGNIKSNISRQRLRS